MAVFNALSVRDLVALVVIASRTAQGSTAGSADLVRDAFSVADEFVELSDGLWANDARIRRRERKHTE